MYFITIQALAQAVNNLQRISVDDIIYKPDNTETEETSKTETETETE